MASDPRDIQPWVPLGAAPDWVYEWTVGLFPDGSEHGAEDGGKALSQAAGRVRDVRDGGYTGALRVNASVASLSQEQFNEFFTPFLSGKSPILEGLWRQLLELANSAFVYAKGLTYGKLQVNIQTLFLLLEWAITIALALWTQGGSIGWFLMRMVSRRLALLGLLEEIAEEMAMNVATEGTVQAMMMAKGYGLDAGQLGMSAFSGGLGGAFGYGFGALVAQTAVRAVRGSWQRGLADGLSTLPGEIVRQAVVNSAVGVATWVASPAFGEERGDFWATVMAGMRGSLLSGAAFYVPGHIQRRRATLHLQTSYMDTRGLRQEGQFTAVVGRDGKALRLFNEEGMPVGRGTFRPDGLLVVQYNPLAQALGDQPSGPQLHTLTLDAAPGIAQADHVNGAPPIELPGARGENALIWGVGRDGTVLLQQELQVFDGWSRVLTADGSWWQPAANTVVVFDANHEVVYSLQPTDTANAGGASAGVALVDAHGDLVGVLSRGSAPDAVEVSAGPNWSIVPSEPGVVLLSPAATATASVGGAQFAVLPNGRIRFAPAVSPSGQPLAEPAGVASQQTPLTLTAAGPDTTQSDVPPTVLAVSPVPSAQVASEQAVLASPMPDTHGTAQQVSPELAARVATELRGALAIVSESRRLWFEAGGPAGPWAEALDNAERTAETAGEEVERAAGAESTREALVRLKYAVHRVREHQPETTSAEPAIAPLEGRRLGAISEASWREELIELLERMRGRALLDVHTAVVDIEGHGVFDLTVTIQSSDTDVRIGIAALVVHGGPQAGLALTTPDRDLVLVEQRLTEFATRAGFPQPVIADLTGQTLTSVSSGQAPPRTQAVAVGSAETFAQQAAAPVAVGLIAPTSLESGGTDEPSRQPEASSRQVSTPPPTPARGGDGGDGNDDPRPVEGLGDNEDYSQFRIDVNQAVLDATRLADEASELAALTVEALGPDGGTDLSNQVTTVKAAGARVTQAIVGVPWTGRLDPSHPGVLAVNDLRAELRQATVELGRVHGQATLALQGAQATIAEIEGAATRAVANARHQANVALELVRFMTAEAGFVGMDAIDIVRRSASKVNEARDLLVNAMAEGAPPKVPTIGQALIVLEEELVGLRADVADLTATNAATPNEHHGHFRAAAGQAVREATRLAEDASKLAELTVGALERAAGADLSTRVSMVKEAAARIEQAVVNVPETGLLDTGHPAVLAVIRWRAELRGAIGELLVARQEATQVLGAAQAAAEKEATEALSDAYRQRTKHAVLAAVDRPPVSAAAAGQAQQEQLAAQALQQAVAVVPFAWGGVEMVGGSTVRFRPSWWAALHGEGHPGLTRVASPTLIIPANIDVRIQFVAELPRGEVRLRRAGDTVLAALLGRVPVSVLEISATVLTDPQPHQELAQILAGAGEQLAIAATGWRLAKLVAGGARVDRMNNAIPAGGRRRIWSAADWGRLRQLFVAGQQARGDLPGTQERIVRALASMGLLSDQKDARQRRAALGRHLADWSGHRAIALRMLDTRSTPDPTAVLAAVEAAADRFVHRSTTFDGAGLSGGAGAVLTLKIAGRVANSEEERLRVPIVVVDTLPDHAAVSLSGGSQPMLLVRADASDLAVSVGLTGVLTDLASDRDRSAGDRWKAAATLENRVVAQLDVIEDQLKVATRADRVAWGHWLHDFRQRVRLKPSSADTTLPVDDMIKAVARAGRPSGVIKTWLWSKVRTQDSSKAHLTLLTMRRVLLAASGQTHITYATKDLVGVPDDQAQQIAFRNYGKQVSQTAADKDYAEKSTFGGGVGKSVPATPGPARVPTAAFRAGPPATIDENIAKRLVPGLWGGALAAGVALYRSRDLVGWGLAAELVLGEGAAGYGQAVTDWAFDIPEVGAGAIRKYFENAEPAKARNDQIEWAYFYLEAVRHRLLRHMDQRALDTTTKAALQEQVDRIHRAISELEPSVRRQADDIVDDMRRRRNALRHAHEALFPPPGRRTETYTYAGLGLPSGAQSSFNNALRVALLRATSGTQAAVYQVLKSWSKHPERALTDILIDPDHATLSALSNLAINVGEGTVYGSLWSPLKKHEVADTSAVAAWDAKHRLREAQYLNSSIAGSLHLNSAASREPAPAPVKPRTFMQGPQEAFAQWRADRAVGRPAEVSWQLQVLFKGGGGLVGRFMGIAISTLFLPAVPGLLTAILRSQIVYWATVAAGEALVKAWTPLFARAQKIIQARDVAARSPLPLVEMLTKVADLFESANQNNKRVQPVHVLPPAPTFGGRLTHIGGTVAAAVGGGLVTAVTSPARIGRWVGDGFSDLTHRRISLRPGPNRPGDIVLTKADRSAVDWLHQTADLLTKAQAQGAKPAALVAKVLRRSLLRELNRLGLIRDQQGYSGRWGAVEEYLRREHGGRPSQLPVLFGLSSPTRADLDFLKDVRHEPGEQPRQAVAEALVLMDSHHLRLEGVGALDHGSIGSIGVRRPMVELTESAHLRVDLEWGSFLVTGVADATVPEGEARLYLPDDDAWHAATGTIAGIPIRLELPTATVIDPQRMRVALTWMLHELNSHRGSRLSRLGGLFGGSDRVITMAPPVHIMPSPVSSP